MTTHSDLNRARYHAADCASTLTEQLTEEIKDLDRKAVRSMPELLKAADYEIYIPE